MQLQIGDRILVKKISGFRWLSETISGATFSEYSHAEPILNEKGDSINAAWPRIKASNISKYFNGKYRVKILRFKGQCSFWDVWLQACKNKIGKRYNLFRRNCAKVVYDADAAIGLFRIKQDVITPQMYNLLAEAGCLFEVVYEAEKPTLEELINELPQIVWPE